MEIITHKKFSKTIAKVVGKAQKHKKHSSSLNNELQVEKKLAFVRILHFIIKSQLKRTFFFSSEYISISIIIIKFIRVHYR